MRCPLCESDAVASLCAHHHRQLGASGEGRRIVDIQRREILIGRDGPQEIAERCRVALVDYVRRVQAERANGGRA